MPHNADFECPTVRRTFAAVDQAGNPATVAEYAINDPTLRYRVVAGAHTGRWLRPVAFKGDGADNAALTLTLTEAGQ